MIAVGLAVVALLGPLVCGVVEYRVTETLRNQTIGLDAVSLFVVAPLALTSAVLVARGRLLGSAFALGIGAYTPYVSAQYILGPDYGHLGMTARCDAALRLLRARAMISSGYALHYR